MKDNIIMRENILNDTREMKRCGKNDCLRFFVLMVEKFKKSIIYVIEGIKERIKNEKDHIFRRVQNEYQKMAIWLFAVGVAVCR